MRHNSKNSTFWQIEGNPIKEYPELKKDLEVDVCIVGAGIAGVTAAYLLSRDYNVVLIDDGQVAEGQTQRTTAHLASAIDASYQALINNFGEKNSSLVFQSHDYAISFIRSIVKKFNIDCSYYDTGAYLLLGPNEKRDFLEDELEACHKIGFKGVELRSNPPLESLGSSPCLYYPDQAQFSPLPYIAKLCEIISEKGEIYCNTHAREFQEKEGKFEIKCEGGNIITAKHLIIATNTPVNNRVFPHLKQSQYRTYVIVAECPKDTVPLASYYDTEDPYHYVRLASIDNEKEFLIIGGEDHRTAEDPEIAEKYIKLEEWSRKRFPMMGKIINKWSGQVVETVDGLPFIGRVKKDLELYIATGFSGNGITYGTISGVLINDLIRKNKNEWADIYDPHRIKIQAALEFAKENFNTLLQYRDWFTPGDVNSEDDIKPECGAIIRRGLKKCALYKDKEGRVKEMSAVCPHLGALVRWNDDEKCWECPAHGSRFSADGKVIQGPANSDLT